MFPRTRRGTEPRPNCMARLARLAIVDFSWTAARAVRADRSASRPGAWGGSRSASCSGLAEAAGREVARIDRLLEELFGIVSPELAHVRIGLDHRVDQPPALLLD